jgi:hypothetical protein
VIDPLAFALTPFSLNVSGAGPAEAEGLADAEGVGEGAGGEPVPARPHPTHRAMVAITTRACFGLKLPPHRFRALPQQVT